MSEVRQGSGASAELAPLQSSSKHVRRSVALGALHAALYPVERFYARRRIDAFGGEVLDVDQIYPFCVRIVLGTAEGDRLDRLMAVGKLHLNEASGRLPFQARHRRNQFVGR